MVRGLKHLSFEERLRIGVVQSGGEKSLGRPYCDLSKGGLKDEQRFTAKACSAGQGAKVLNVNSSEYFFIKKFLAT